jgi:hypothetical protein
MPWASVCGAYADGTLDGRHFRRLKAVKHVVETVGITEARFYVQRIKEWGPKWLDHPMVLRLDDWGDPIRCPAMLLGTSRPFSPTTLRYLATALWLERSGKMTPGAQIHEIGVGFGGLAAMNAIVSGTTTFLVDLPQVERAAIRMLSELGLNGSAMRANEADRKEDIPLVISNYAFSELSAGLQDDYLAHYLIRAKHGVIVSNAAVFSSHIGGRTDQEIVNWLRGADISVSMEDFRDNDLLTPIDALCDVRLIHW